MAHLQQSDADAGVPSAQGERPEVAAVCHRVLFRGLVSVSGQEDFGGKEVDITPHLK
jgi:hypothetical protein